MQFSLGVWVVGLGGLASAQPTQVLFPRAYGVVSMCIGTGMGAAAVFEYPGN
jgi:acetyl-CoA acetyltransferase